MQSNVITCEYAETVRQAVDESVISNVKTLIKMARYYRYLAEVLQISGGILAAIAALLGYVSATWVLRVDKMMCFMSGTVGMIASIIYGWAHGVRKKALDYEEIISKVYHNIHTNTARIEPHGV